jgi:mRNA interferase RelE/StbE
MEPRRRERNRLRSPDETADFIRILHPAIKRKIKAALKTILSDPDAGKSLRDELKGLRSDRAGRFRIIYRNPTKGVVDILAIGPRKII